MRRPLLGQELYCGLRPLNGVTTCTHRCQTGPLRVWAQLRFKTSARAGQQQRKAKTSQERTTRQTRNGSSGITVQGTWSSLQKSLSKHRRLLAIKRSDEPPEPKPKPPRMIGKIPGIKQRHINAAMKSMLPTKLKATHVPLTKQSRTQIPNLSHGLDRVLFNPGVYDLRDQRSGVFNFDPYLSQLIPNEKFDFDALGSFLISSKDPKLQSMTKEHRKKYFSSTSSITGLLSQLHYLLSGWRPPNYDMLSRTFRVESHNYTTHAKAPAAAFLRYRDGVYAIDADKSFDTDNILSFMGRSMEKLLTLPKEEYEKYTKQLSHQLPEDEKKRPQEVHNYMRVGDFLLRSQLDAQDRRLPGSGVFDVKTRAVVSIRMDVKGYEKGQGYEIWRRHGQWESFEREYYDMIRSAFLKYSLQVRIGGMDGIFVAYHNTKRLFGFQYVGLEEMDHAIHGTRDKALGDGEFKASMTIMNALLDRATKRFPNKTLHFHMECRPTQTPLLYFFAQPIEEDVVDSMQDKQMQNARQISDEILQSSGEPLGEAADAAGVDAADTALWEAMVRRSSEALEDRNGMDVLRQALKDEIDRVRAISMKSDLEREADLDMLVEALSSDVSSGTIVPSAFGKLKVEEATDSNAAVEAEQEGESEDTSMDHASAAGDPEFSEELEFVESSVIQGNDESNMATDALAPDFDKTSAEEDFSDGSGYASMPLPKLIRLVAESAMANPESSSKSSRALERMFAELLMGSRGSEDSATTGQASKADKASQKEETEILGLYVTTKHIFNGKPVERPQIQSDPLQEWKVEYSIGEVPKAYAPRLCRDLKARRAKVYEDDITQKRKRWRQLFQGSLHKYSAEGIKKRKEVKSQDMARGKIFVAWDNKARPPTEMENELA